MATRDTILSQYMLTCRLESSSSGTIPHLLAIPRETPGETIKQELMNMRLCVCVCVHRECVSISCIAHSEQNTYKDIIYTHASYTRH